VKSRQKHKTTHPMLLCDCGGLWHRPESVVSVENSRFEVDSPMALNATVHVTII